MAVLEIQRRYASSADRDQSLPRTIAHEVIAHDHNRTGNEDSNLE
jgi:hypothetical protein